MQKDQFLKNKYKFQGERLSEGKLGRETDGMLTLSKRDIMRINGKQPNEKRNSDFKPSAGFKQKKVRKGKKGGKGGRKGGKKH